MSGEIRTTSFAVKSKLFRNCCIRRPLRWLSDGAAVRVRWCGGGLLSGSNVVLGLAGTNGTSSGSLSSLRPPPPLSIE
ncbi:unnamed protein product [Rhodiola kirilowii]